MTDPAPGFWDSPISAEMLAAAGTRLAFTQPLGEALVALIVADLAVLEYLGLRRLNAPA